MYRKNAKSCNQLIEEGAISPYDMITYIKRDFLSKGSPFSSVGVRGFEPRTSRTRTVRSTGLSHTPNVERANYTIAFCFGKLWIEQDHLAV